MFNDEELSTDAQNVNVSWIKYECFINIWMLSVQWLKWFKKFAGSLKNLPGLQLSNFVAYLTVKLLNTQICSVFYRFVAYLETRCRPGKSRFSQTNRVAYPVRPGLPHFKPWLSHSVKLDCLLTFIHFMCIAILACLLIFLHVMCTLLFNEILEIELKL